MKTGNLGYGGLARRKGPKDGKARHRSKRKKQPKIDSLRDQPAPDSDSSVRCELCGAQIAPNRLHFHMVRCHGAALRSKGIQA